MRQQQAPAATSKGNGPPIGSYHNVGGRRLLVYRSGSGTPSVVFLSGAGTVGLDYLNVQTLAAEVSTAVLYDRAGTGWSDPVALPRSSRQVTDELDELVRVADLPGPYVLVGHSLGGLYARHYAARFPERVAGLVLLDPAHEDYNKYMPEALTAMRSGNRRFALLNAVLSAALSNPITSRLLVLLPPLRRMQDTYRDLFEAETADKGFPEPLRRVLMDRHVSPQWLRVGMLEAKNVEDLYREVQTAGPLPDVPLVVICSMSTDGFRAVVSSGGVRGTGAGRDRRQAAPV